MSLTIFDLPVEMINKIVEELDTFSRFNLEKVSKAFRIIVDRLKPSFKTLDFYINTDNSINLIFDKFSVITYRKEGNSCSVVYENHKKSIIGVDHIEIALGDLARALKNPKLQLERLGLFSDTKDFILLKKCLNSQIHVKKLILKTHKIDEIPRILTIFQPGTLKYIEFRNEPKTRKNLLKIVNLEQMKRARNLKFLELGVKIRMSNGNRFKIYKKEFDVEDIVRLRDVKMPVFRDPMCSLCPKKTVCGRNAAGIVLCYSNVRASDLEPYGLFVKSLFGLFIFSIFALLFAVGYKSRRFIGAALIWGGRKLTGATSDAAAAITDQDAAATPEIATAEGATTTDQANDTSKV
ncbi:hypothetical protein GCK72_021162 [Caenorhabditis remanei]|uniref:F-box domain-containing protein n=1 Tax=Caenorhabditis remanei TaxID=31234 RepID=A0A6A5GJU4_CAERE|nr:hypothetical protein GCK72_021162 [Caenorhabditis remanei]KAF1754599.1 hypothetical protein GCK72_021162 [Caenorhabditis remanei]